MLTRNSTRWIAPIVILAVCGVTLAYNRIAATTVQPAIGLKDVNVAAVEPLLKKHHPVVLPKINRKHCEPWPGEWIQYPADDVLPHGLKIEVTAGVITGVATEEGDRTDYDILGTRYVAGDLDATDITCALWRYYALEMPKPDGSIAEIRVARPLWWGQATGAQVGKTIDLGMQEIGISGEAKVLKVTPCDVDSRDNEKDSQIITGNIKHRNAEVWDLVFNNDSGKPLGVTANHPIMSADRNDWVPAGELRILEKVKTADGTATLTSKSKRATRETVYNVEVHRSHAYHVSQFGILAHNTTVLNCTKTAVFRGDGTRVARPIDMKMDKKTGLLIPERTGLSVNVDQQKVLSITNKDGTPKFSSAPPESGGFPMNFILFNREVIRGTMGSVRKFQ